MILSDLLSELRDNILHDRSHQISGSGSDYLWSNATLVRYINEAQRRLAVRGLVLRDGKTAEVCQVTLKTGISDYTLHPAVIAVLSARLAGEPADLMRVGHWALGAYTTTGADAMFEQLSTMPPGKPLAFTTDETLDEDDDGTISAVVLRVLPTPTADYNNQVINLRVCRKPIADLVVGNLSATPEVPVDHHLDMLDWAAYLALRIVDQDAGNAKRAADFATSFEAHVIEARNLLMRKVFTPQAWGFGRNGWSWGN